MIAKDFFSKLQAYRTVLTRTRPRNELPTQVLYLEWLAGQGKRRVIDTEGNEHVITDKMLQSNYKMATGSSSKKIISQYWADIKKTTPSKKNQ